MPRDYLADSDQDTQLEKPSGRDFLTEDEPNQEPHENPFVNGLRNVGAGFLQSLKATAEPWAEALSPLKELLHPQNPNEMKPGQAANQAIGSLLHGTPQEEQLSGIDPYKMMGTKPAEHYFNSPEGLEQFAGEFGPSLYGAGSLLAKSLRKLSPENIAQNIVHTGEAIKNKYSGADGLYTNLFKSARQEGVGQVKVNPNKIDINTIEEFANPKYTESLEKFVNNPDIENAHWAQSDLKKYIRYMSNKSSLTKPEQKSLNAATEAKNHIVENMFGNNDKLSNHYNEITKGYRKEYIPYTNKNIQNYKSGELLPQELLPKLKTGKFAATRGEHHPELYYGDKINYLTKALGIGSGAALGGAGAVGLYKAFNK